MTVILDFDYTLFDTARFKEALVRALMACGPTRDEILRSYSDVVNRPGTGYDYDPDVQLETLSGSLRCSMKEASDALEAVGRRSAEFVYPGAADFLRHLKDKGHRLILLTLGNGRWQRFKLEHSGLEKYFDLCETTLLPKSAEILRLAGADKAIIVNDNGDEIAAMKAAAPGLRYILKRGPKPIPDGLDVPDCETFEELETVISA